MTLEQLFGTLAGALLALLFAYVPGLSEWFAHLGERPDGSYDNGTLKRLVMLGLLLVSAGGVVGLACAGFGADLGLPVTCDRPGLVQAVMAFVAAVLANQGAYMLAPVSKSVAAIKAARKEAEAVFAGYNGDPLL